MELANVWFIYLVFSELSVIGEQLECHGCMFSFKLHV